MDCEQWRKDFGVEGICKDFNYVEKPKVFEYYPQYYHKTDKVSSSCLATHVLPQLMRRSRCVGWPPSLH